MTQTTHVLRDGTELFVRDEGNGSPVLFVHGFPLDHTMWDAQVAAFVGAHRCLAVDLRGFGQSSVTRGTVTMEQMADDLANLLDALKIHEPVTLCGLSMGGYVAWQFWKRHAARLGRLILCDTRAIADTPEGSRQRLEIADQVESEGTSFLADAMLPKLYGSETQTTQPELVAASRDIILRTVPAGVAAAQRGMAARPDVTDWLPSMSIPCLLVTGEQDAISPVEEMARIASRLPLAKHTIVPGAGHMAPQEQPDLVNQAIREFLSAV